MRKWFWLSIMLTAFLWMAQGSFGADKAAESAKKSSVNPFILVKDNLDPVFYVILGCSVIGVGLIIQGFIQSRFSAICPDATTRRIRSLIEAGQKRELVEFVSNDPSFVSKALVPALKRSPDFNAMKEALETSVAEQTAEQFRKIEYLNIIGNLGPLLGLLGTVLGMIDAFAQMHIQGGEAAAGTLAHGISKALCHTMLGLMLALPCLAAFGILRTLVDRITIKAALLAEDLLLSIKPEK